MKLKSVYVCSNCGETSPRWMGRCPSCGSWNTMNEDVVAEAPKAGTPAARQAAAARQEGVTTLTARRLSEISTTEEKSRILTGISELDRVLGGGIVLGGVVLLSGEPGHGCPVRSAPAAPPAETAKAAPPPMPAPPVRFAPGIAALRPALHPAPGAWRSGRLRHRWPPGCAAAGCRRTELPRHPAGCAPSTAPAKRRTEQSPPASWRTAAASAGRKAVLKTSEA